ncbi:unnamed protein product [Discosporangium mesarthrocarpum]
MGSGTTWALPSAWTPTPTSRPMTAPSRWQGQAVVVTDGGDLILDSCDFRRSSADYIVSAAPAKPALIRNAIFGEFTISGAATGNSDDGEAVTLVDNSHACLENDPCGGGILCEDGGLGVFCSCYTPDVTGEEVCLDGEGQVMLAMAELSAQETIGDEHVLLALKVMALGGTTPVLWSLEPSSEHYHIYLDHSHGILLQDTNVTVRATAKPIKSVHPNGDLDIFISPTLNSSPNEPHALKVEGKHFLCGKEQYYNGSCSECMRIGDGGEGVSCSKPGSTLETISLKQGYWWPNLISLDVRQCIYPSACRGGSDVSSINGYCDQGYKGTILRGVCQQLCHEHGLPVPQVWRQRRDGAGRGVRNLGGDVHGDHGCLPCWGHRYGGEGQQRHSRVGQDDEDVLVQEVWVHFAIHWEEHCWGECQRRCSGLADGGVGDVGEKGKDEGVLTGEEKKELLLLEEASDAQ